MVPGIGDRHLQAIGVTGNPEEELDLLHPVLRVYVFVGMTVHGLFSRHGEQAVLGLILIDGEQALLNGEKPSSPRLRRGSIGFSRNCFEFFVRQGSHIKFTLTHNLHRTFSS